MFFGNSEIKSPYLLFSYLSSVWGEQQPLALIITTTTCHSSHHNTVRAVPVTVWEDGWEEMCLYCNLAQRVCAVWPRPEIFFGMLSRFFFLKCFLFLLTPTHISFSVPLHPSPFFNGTLSSPVKEEADRIAIAIAWLVTLYQIHSALILASLLGNSVLLILTEQCIVVVLFYYFYFGGGQYKQNWSHAPRVCAHIRFGSWPCIQASFGMV